MYTAVRNRQISFPALGTTTGGGGEQRHNYVNGSPYYQCDHYLAGHPLPGPVGAEMIKSWSSCVINDHEAENGVGVHPEATNIVNNQVDMTRKKTKWTSKQVEALKMSFQEDVELEQQRAASGTIKLRKNRMKLEPERKIKLSDELRLHPRQVATWFQNRRARLKRKEIERLYNVLKQDYEIISRENQHLHQETEKQLMELGEKVPECVYKEKCNELDVYVYKAIFSPENVIQLSQICLKTNTFLSQT